MPEIVVVNVVHFPFGETNAYTLDIGGDVRQADLIQLHLVQQPKRIGLKNRK